MAFHGDPPGWDNGLYIPYRSTPAQLQQEPAPPLFSIRNEGTEKLRIEADGSVVLAPGTSHEEAACLFWAALGKVQQKLTEDPPDPSTTRVVEI